jgi:hypothetical protein
MGRYVLRVFADREERNCTEAGTTVQPLELQVSYFSESADEAEKKLNREVKDGKLPAGRVYQICPPLESFEPIRTCAVGLDGSSRRVFLDPVEGLYGSARRIRLPLPATIPDD